MVQASKTIGKRNGIEVALLGMIFSVVAKVGYTVKLGVSMLPVESQLIHAGQKLHLLHGISAAKGTNP